MATSGLKINELFDAGNPYGNVAFDITLDSQRPVNGNFSGNVKALVTEVDFKGYTYKNVNLTGNFMKNGFNGMIKVDDPNGTLYAEGLFEHRGKNSVFNFVADLEELLKTHKIVRFALFDQFAYSEHIECGVILEKIKF
jgi:hypothetical protein